MNDFDTEGSQDIPWKGIIGLLILVPLMLATLLLSAGRFAWWEAWAYTGMALLVLVGSRLIMNRKNPGLALERSQALGKGDVKEWDKFFLPFTALIAPFISWIVAGLDQRFGWSGDLPNGVQIAALVVIQLGSLVGSWAMISNRFFSSQVRIQKDRGHSVVKDGPYKYVRHPGYAGGLVSWLAAPIFFSSWWTIIPTVIAISASVIRTALEDRTLQEELPGYREYTEEVKFRLVPGIW